MIATRLQLIFPLFGQSISNSYTQVFFSKDKVLGLLLILVSMFDYNAGLGGLVCVASANGLAFLIGLNRQKTIDGLYGFNALLTGLGLGLYYQINTAFLVVLVFSAILSLMLTIMLEGVLSKYGLPYLSLPFLMSLWVVMLSTREFTHLTLSERGIYMLNEMYLLGGMPLVKAYEWFGNLGISAPVKMYFRSLGAIFFQYHLFAGLVIAIGLLRWSRLAFLYSVAGFATAWIFYQITGSRITGMDYSYIGFNFILTAIALGVFFTVPSPWSLLWVIITVPVLAFLISAGSLLLGVYQLSVYSLPFNLVVILLLYLFKVRERFHEKPALVYIQQGIPERNLYSYRVNRHRLWHLGTIPVRLPFHGKWVVTQGIDGDHTHKDSWKYAWDFEMTDDEGLTYQGKGLQPQDYYCFAKPVVAVADGYVTDVEDGVADNEVGDVNLRNNWGNSIVIHHAEGFFSQMSHLRKGSLLVKKGQYVRKGEQLASCGNSGRSPYPHLHFQFQTAGEIGAATLNYPFTAYLKYGSETAFVASAQPRIGEQLSHSQVENALDLALHFIPGQVIRFRVEYENKTEEISWITETDSYNNSYLLCEQSGAKAWFIRQPEIFYFTHFEGDKSSRLFDFYLGAYQLITSFTPELRMEESITTALYPNKGLLMLQDFFAPFWQFLSISFKMRQVKLVNDLSSSRINIETTVSWKVLNKSRGSRRFGIIFENNQLQTFIIHDGEKVISFERI